MRVKNRDREQIFEHIRELNISEQEIYNYCPKVLDTLLVDHTMSAQARDKTNDQENYAGLALLPIFHNYGQQIRYQ